jgi:uncharacterized protein (TIGR00251 family)
MKILVKIKAAAKENKISGWLGDVLKIHIAAMPVDGKANRELIKFLAQKLEIQKSDIKILSGLTEPIKILEINTKKDVLAIFDKKN